MKESNYVTLFFNVPLTHASEVRKAMGDAGAGKMGNYTHCSFSTRGIGRFKPTDKASPFIGKSGELEEVEEERVQTVCSNELLPRVLQAIKLAHPYEEVVIDMIPIYEEGIKGS